MLIIGIDPGEKSGGIGLINQIGQVTAFKMLNIPAFIVFCRLHLSKARFFIEHLQPLPSRVRGSVASFKLGKHYGELLGVLQSTGCNFSIVRPQLWQGRLGCSYPGQEISYTEKKKRNRLLAQKLFSDIKVTHAIADALLIAEYGRRITCEK